MYVCIISIVLFLILDGKICLLIWEQIRNGTAPFHHQYCSISNSGSQNFACLYRNRSGMGHFHSIISIVPFLILDCKICLLHIPYSGCKICLLIREQIRNGTAPFHHQYCSIPNLGCQNMPAFIPNCG